jgi:drug/metabolite transporter (DMT)-like permease
VNHSRTAILAALASALLFGGTVPFAKLLAGDMSPLLLAGLLYVGSGLGLWTWRILRDGHLGLPRLPPRDWWCFLGAIAAGGVIAPVLLMTGLKHTAASSASLLLNLEAVFTSIMAWLVFRENTDRRLVFGMLLIVSGGAVLAGPPAVWPPVAWARGGMAVPAVRGALFIAAACACWAIDNNLTRRVSLVDADFIAGTKGLAAGMTNLLLAVVWGAGFPPPSILLSAMALGLLGYGVSLMLFVLALRGLGAARAGAYFSTAPFLGAAIAIIALHEPTHPGFWLSALLMAAGVAIHMTERHSHKHTHETLAHSHVHTHDAHHRHEHPSSWDGVEPHSHEHRHEGFTHEHAHYPDLHHRHGH